VSGQLIWLGRHDSLLAGELALMMHCIVFSVDLLSMTWCSLSLPKGVPSLEREPGVILWCNGPRWNRHHVLRGYIVLWPWCGCNGGRWTPHAVPLGDGEVGAPLFARGYVELVDGVLEDGSQ
jgi:hypothetical protein